MRQIAGLLGIGVLVVGPALMIAAAWSGSRLFALTGGAAAACAVVLGALLAMIALREEAFDAAGAGSGSTSEEPGSIRPPAGLALAAGARWTATAYAWGAISMMGAYYLSPLSWYHAYQYAGLMAVFAAIALWMNGRLLAEPEPGGTLKMIAVVLGVAQIVLGFVGIGYLVVSGELASPKTNWLAHIILFAGAWMIAAVSFLSLPHASRK